MISSHKIPVIQTALNNGYYIPVKISASTTFAAVAITIGVSSYSFQTFVDIQVSFSEICATMTRIDYILYLIGIILVFGG